MQDDLQWLYLDLNSFFASVEQQMRPELRGRPVAVVPAPTDATCAIAASYEAKAFGIKTGTKIYDAKRLCPDLVCIEADHEHYVRFHHSIMRAIDRHIPIFKAESIDEFSCRLDKSEANEDIARALAERIKADIAERIGICMRSSIGLAPNRFLAKTASNLQKPDGLQVLHAADVPARIAHLPVEALVGVGAGMQRRLARVGVFTVGQLYQLAPKQMRHIWHSVQGERFYHMLRGIEIPPEPTERRTIGHSHMLEPEWRTPERAYEVMRRLLLKAASRLRRMEYLASHLSLSVRLHNGKRLELTANFEHCCDNSALQQAAITLWKTMLAPYDGHSLKKVSLTLHGLRASAERNQQASLLEMLNPRQTQQRQRHETLSYAMDKLNTRFGRDTITMGGLPQRVRSFSGTKIAFTRIPDQAEFHE